MSKKCGPGTSIFYNCCPASQVKRRPSATGLLLRTHSDGPVSQTCLLRLLRRELLRAVTLDDWTPQRRISELRVWSYEPLLCSRHHRQVILAVKT
jgi:hypothetical protein